MGIQFRAMAVGCLGDVIQYFALHEMNQGQTHPATQEYLPKSFEVALSMAVLEGDEYLQMRQNSFFCLGALFQAGGAAAAQFHEPFLKAAVPVLHIPKGGSKVTGFMRDNAVSAICKMIKHSGDKLPRETLRNLAPLLLNCLPLERDLIENKY